MPSLWDVRVLMRARTYVRPTHLTQGCTGRRIFEAAPLSLSLSHGLTAPDTAITITPTSEVWHRPRARAKSLIEAPPLARPLARLR